MSRMTDEDFARTASHAERKWPKFTAEARRARAREAELEALHVPAAKQRLHGAKERIAELERALSASQERERVLESALRGVMADTGGGRKHCAHRYSCSCAWDAARAALQSPPTPAPEPKHADVQAAFDRWFSGHDEAQWDDVDVGVAFRAGFAAAAPAPEPEREKRLAEALAEVMERFPPNDVLDATDDDAKSGLHRKADALLTYAEIRAARAALSKSQEGRHD